MNHELPDGVAAILSERDAILEDIRGLFTFEGMTHWADEIRACPGNHPELWHLVRKINMHPLKFQLVEYRRDSLIPDASWATIQGFPEELHRDICVNAGMLADILVYSRMVPHSLNDEELETVYKHHCVEHMVRCYPGLEINRETRLKLLLYYVNRITVQTLRQTDPGKMP